MKKYRIKQYEALCTRYKGGKWATEQIETRYQVEMRLKGFWGWLWGWSDIGATLDTEQEARLRIAEYKRAEAPRLEQREKGVRYIEID
jgi:hypothetical protein